MNWSNLVHILVKTEEMKKILYIDTDNVLVDFPSGVSKLSQEVIKEYESNLTKYSLTKIYSTLTWKLDYNEIDGGEIVYKTYKEWKRTPPPICRESGHTTRRICFKYWIGVYRAIQNDGFNKI